MHLWLYRKKNESIFLSEINTSQTKAGWVLRNKELPPPPPTSFVDKIKLEKT